MMVTRKLTAWLVHCYTALGLVAAAGMAVFIVRGDAESFRRAIALMIVATFIDLNRRLAGAARAVKSIAAIRREPP